MKANELFDAKDRNIIEDYEVRMGDSARLVARITSDNEMLEIQVSQNAK